jgi:hypothetical protein
MKYMCVNETHTSSPKGSFNLTGLLLTGCTLTLGETKLGAGNRKLDGGNPIPF